MDLPKPNVTRCFFDHSFDPPLPAMELKWDLEEAAAYERAWRLPDSVSLTGPAPRRFGVTIHRLSENTYQVRVLWNQLCLSWDGLTRLQVMTSSLAEILRALGTDVWDLLNQPVEAKRKAA
jgi:hypothetical protein